MTDLFDSLQSELDNRSKDEGISPMDLLDLPEQMRMIMRKMLRSGTMRKEEILEFASSWDEDKRLDEADLEKTLSELAGQGWLIQIGEGDSLGYRVNLRRKKSSQLSSSIWDAIDSKLSKKEED